MEEEECSWATTMATLLLSFRRLGQTPPLASQKRWLAPRSPALITSRHQVTGNKGKNIISEENKNIIIWPLFLSLWVGYSGSNNGYSTVERNNREQSSKVFPSELEMMTLPSKQAGHNSRNDCPYSTLPRYKNRTITTQWVWQFV